MKLIQMIEPDVLIKGADYKVSEIVGADFVLSRGGKVHRCPMVQGKSSSNIIRMVKR
jgi:D-beta-D-heptose 7-phosphate kinase/D-beta-D-heptose 1-phosphate adenosyltransferase